MPASKQLRTQLKTFNDRKRAVSQSGFTLLELLVVMTIMSLVSLMSITSYNTYSDTQRLKQAALTLVNNLRLAQSNAQSGLVPSGCGSFAGYVVSFTVSTYTVDPICQNPGPYSQSFTKTLPNTITMTVFPASLTFGVLTSGITNINVDTKITFTGSGKTFSVTVSPSGDIKGHNV